MLMPLDQIFTSSKNTIAEYVHELLVKEDYIIGSGPIYGTLVLERLNSTELELFFDRFNSVLAENNLTQQFYLIVHSINANSDYSTLCNEVLPIDYFALKTYCIMKYSNHPVNPVWNLGSTRALFLTGKANKKHRIGLLSKFYDQGMIDQLEWSLFVNPGVIDDIIQRDLVPQYSPEELMQFIGKCQRNPDSIAIEMQPSSSHYSGFPFNVNLFKDTVFSCISETNFGINYNNDPAWITEKTWKAIVNRHPWTIAGESNTLVNLESLGFKTFTNYLKYPDYLVDNCSEDEKLSLIVENVKYFLENHHRHANEIMSDIEWNYSKFIEYSLAEMNKLSTFISKSGNKHHSEYEIIKATSYW